MKWSQNSLAWLISGSLLLATAPAGCAAQTDPSVPPPPPLAAPATAAQPGPQQSSEELDQLVAPIALYPDPLIAQILAAATFPV